ncbi:MAG: hypothetical protein HGA66_05930 [Holophaga sp.]|nr:hypothetical protein [Holophaga sp.]
MNYTKTFLLAAAAVATLAVRAELTPEVEAKFLKAIIASSGTNKIACDDAALKGALEAQGIVVDSGASICWVTNPNIAKTMKQFGRLVITNRRDLAGSASVLIVEDNGRPKLILNTANLKTAKVQLSDAVLKIAEKI